MFIRQLLLFLCVIFACRLGFGQTVTLSPSPIEENTFDNVKVIGQDEYGFFLLQSNLPLDMDRDRVGFKNRKYKMSYYNNEMVLKWSRVIDPFPATAVVQSVQFLQQRILITAGEENKSQRQLSFYGYWMNNKGEMTDSREIGKISLEKNSDYEKPKLTLSANQRVFAFSVNEFINSDSQVIHFLLCNPSFAIMQQKKLAVNYGEKQFIATDYSLSNNGDFNVLGVRNTKDKTTGNKKQQDYVLLSVPTAAMQFSEFTMGEGSKDVTNAAINFDNVNNKIVCAGLYAEKTSTTGAGVLYASLAMTDSAALNLKTQLIDTRTQIKLLGERNNGYDIGLVSYPIERIILRNDGGAVIVAEASFTSDYSYFDYFSQSYTRRTEYHYNNVVVISVNNDGNIHWLNMVRKEQESEEDGGVFSSFCTLLTPDELILIYNNEISRNADSYSSHISNTGKQNDTKVLKSNEHLLLFARSGKQISENEAIIPCIAKKKLMLAKFTF